MSEVGARLRQPVVVVLGHVDSGKCVDGETLLQLADGRILKAVTAYEGFRKGQPTSTPDGVVSEAQGLALLSVAEDGQVRGRGVSHVWKLRSDRMVKVKTRAGYDVSTTPEHRFLVLGPDGEVRYVEAERLRLGDRLLIANKTPVNPWSLLHVKETIIRSLSDDFLLRPSKQLNRELVKYSRREGIYAVGEAVGDKLLHFHLEKGYYRASVLRKLAVKAAFPVERLYDAIDRVKFASPKRRASHTSFWLRLPHSEAEMGDLFYLAGLLFGDGIAGTAHLSNTSQALIREYKRCLKVAFGVGAKATWRRTSYIVTHRGSKSLSRFFVETLGYPETDKTRTLAVPEVITASPDRLLAGFLRGFFDAEGWVEQRNNVGIACESPTIMKQLPMLLHRYGCLAYFAKKKARLELIVSGETNLRAFIDSIGFSEPSKAKLVEQCLSKAQSSRIFDKTPLSGDFVRSFRNLYAVHGNDEFQLNYYESRRELTRHALQKLFALAPEHEEKRLAATLENFRAVEVSGVEVREGEFDVYDFTVDETHNFIANDLIVHNTSLLDKIRGTAVQAREAGGITQEIGASYFPLETLQAISGTLLEKAGGELQVPGLLVIDTPGHEVFSNLRMRGGSAADIAILVVDVLKGLENQTLESIDILKQRRVPFLVALNKIDMIKGWRKESRGPLLQILKEQTPEWNDEFEERLYNVVGGLSRLSFQSDAYYRVKDFKQQVSIVPVSARYAAGIPELLAMLIGLAQQFLKGKLQLIGQGHGGRGIILEMQEEVGIGETANVILTEGRLKVGDGIALVRRDGAFPSKVKALFMPKPLDEMRDPRDKFTSVPEVYAAAGVKLLSADLKGVVPGTSVVSFQSEPEFMSLKPEMEKELTSILVKTDNMGVIVRAGSVGGLEALLRMLEERGVPVREGDIGDISRNDIVNAAVVGDHDPYLAAILAFDSKVLPDAKEFAAEIPIFTSNVIYEVIDSYVDWAAKKRSEDERAALSNITPPCKLRAIPGDFFRNKDPAVFGVEILAGKLRPKVKLMDRDGRELGTVEQIQDKGKAIPEAKLGDKVAISVRGPTLGRSIKENDALFSQPRSHEVKLLRSKFLAALSEDELQALNEIMGIKSALDPLYGF